MNKEMLKGTVDLLILSVLKGRDSYGYEISKIIKTRSGDFEILEATLYLSLKRLEKQQLIQSYWGNETEGGRRKYYRITDSGMAQYTQLSSDWKQTVELVGRFIEQEE